MVTRVMTDVLVAPNNFGDTRSGGLVSSIGTVVILGMAVATILLIRNMSARLRRLPDKFPDPAHPADQPGGPGRTPVAREAPPDQDGSAGPTRA